MDPDDDGVYRLEGSNGDEVGGLVLKSKPIDDEGTFKTPFSPKKSVLGLDKLAGMLTLSIRDLTVTNLYFFFLHCKLIKLCMVIRC